MPRHNSPWLKLSSLFIAAALLAGACGSSRNDSQFTNLAPTNPVAQIPEGLALSANPATLKQDFGVRLTAIAADDFNGGLAGSRWSKALTALPANLRLKGPLYEIQTTGQLPDQLFLSVIVPANADPANLDLYAWDGEAWTFLASHLRGNQLVASVTQAPSALGLFEAAPLPPLAFTTLEPGQALTAAAASAVNAVLLGGVQIRANGSLTGQLPNAAFDPSLAIYPIIRNYDRYGADIGALGSLLVDMGVRANHLQALVAFAASGNYDGLVLDYRGLNDSLAAAYTQFVRALATQLHAQGRTLFVAVPTPATRNGSFATDGYDWRALGASADALLVPLSNDPASVTNGSADALLTWAVGEASRSRLRLVTSALSVDGVRDRFTLLDQASALAPLGSATAAPETKGALSPGQPITLTLSGKAQTLGYDAAAFATRYTYTDDASTTHTVWLTTAETLRQRLALAQKYRLGGVAVADLLDPGVPAELATAITQYRVNLTAAPQAQANLLWTVSSGSGVIAQATAQPDQPYVYVAKKPGAYQFSAELQNGSSMSLGSVEVSVAKVTATPAPQGGGGGSTGFVPPPPIAAGIFELGGQVPGFISHAAQMQQAGMKWVKSQAIGDTAGFIASGHANGFKVLLSVVGDKNRATDPAYWSEYAAWVAGMAAQGADAIEVWNEANLDREWPNGQISGATYTQLLQQAYTAIKAANSSTLVISGAPSPTGAAGAAGCTPAFCNDDEFLSQMAAAGAANYLDCVGVHFNDGTTSPNDTSGSALGGYHYSFYFWPMVNLYYNAFGGSRPLCFTELGYVSPEGYESIPLPSYFQWAASNTVAEQAQWLADTASLSASSGQVKLLIVFNVDFTQYIANDPQAGYAILRPDGSCPACAALDAVMP